jgi:hypothetical protein
VGWFGSGWPKQHSREGRAGRVSWPVTLRGAHRGGYEMELQRWGRAAECADERDERGARVF